MSKRIEMKGSIQLEGVWVRKTVSDEEYEELERCFHTKDEENITRWIDEHIEYDQLDSVVADCSEMEIRLLDENGNPTSFPHYGPID